MIIYNVTTMVNWSVHDQWKEWMISEHLPDLLATGVFSHYQMVRLLEVDENEGPTYATQLYLHEGRNIGDYKTHHLPLFEQREKDLWGDNAYSFASLMEVIN